MTTTQAVRLVAISAGTSDPSSTRLLADRLLAAAGALGGERGLTIDTEVIELRPLATDIAQAVVTGFAGTRLTKAIDIVAAADALVVSTPVYKAGPSGLFKSFIDVLDNDLVIGTPTVLAATAGTARHALVVDESLRSLFAYLRAFTVPTSVFAASKDWGTPALSSRIDRAALELLTLIESGVRQSIRGKSWGDYQHSLGSSAQVAGGGEAEIVLDPALLRLATGG